MGHATHNKQCLRFYSSLSAVCSPFICEWCCCCCCRDANIYTLFGNGCTRKWRERSPRCREIIEVDKILVGICPEREFVVAMLCCFFYYIFPSSCRLPLHSARLWMPFYLHIPRTHARTSQLMQFQINLIEKNRIKRKSKAITRPTTNEWNKIGKRGGKRNGSQRILRIDSCREDNEWLRDAYAGVDNITKWHRVRRNRTTRTSFSHSSVARHTQTHTHNADSLHSSDYF